VTAYDEKLAAAIAKAGVPLSADLAAPQATLRDRMAALVARQRACWLLADAADRSNSPSDQIAYHLDEWLVTHPDAKVTQLADYPAWAAEMAARENANRAARNAPRGTL
jgi:hypothetical protein